MKQWRHGQQVSYHLYQNTFRRRRGRHFLYQGEDGNYYVCRVGKCYKVKPGRG